MTKIVVYVEGGCVTSIMSDDAELTVIMFDHDSIREGDPEPELPADVADFTEVY